MKENDLTIFKVDMGIRELDEGICLRVKLNEIMSQTEYLPLKKMLIDVLETSLKKLKKEVKQ